MRTLATILAALFLFLIPSQITAQTSEKASSAKQASSAEQSTRQTNTKANEPAAELKTKQTKLTETPKDDSTAVTDTPNKTFDLTFDDLKFEMEKGSKFDRSLLTDKINSYDNNIITVRGYIRPSFSQSGLKKFIFVRDNKECCFGPGAALYDCILVRLAKGKTTDYTVRPITIKGRFSLKEYEGPDGKVWSIYRMNETDVK